MDYFEVGKLYKVDHRIFCDKNKEIATVEAARKNDYLLCYRKNKSHVPPGATFMVIAIGPLMGGWQVIQILFEETVWWASILVDPPNKSYEEIKGE